MQLRLNLPSGDDAPEADGLVSARNEAYVRPIHYLGSKLRIIDPIVNCVLESAKPSGPVVDLFSGSGTVSCALSRHRATISIDMQEYSRVITSGLISLPPINVGNFLELTRTEFESLSAPFENIISAERAALQSAKSGDFGPLVATHEYGPLAAIIAGDRKPAGTTDVAKAMQQTASSLVENGLGSDAASLVTRHFGGLYFSFEQAVWLDAALSAAHCFGPSKDRAIAMALSAASDLVNTVGKQFAQPLRPFSKTGELKMSAVRMMLRDRSKDGFVVLKRVATQLNSVPVGFSGSKSLKGDYVTCLRELSEPLGAVYADPPYTRDHYSRFYHVLETMSLRDEPEISKSNLKGRLTLSRGMYRIDRHQSPFCVKSEAPRAFAELVDECSDRNAPLIISYSPYAKDKNAHPRVVTLDKICEIANVRYKSIEVVSVGRVFHSRFNNHAINKPIDYEAEKLIVCKSPVSV